MTAGDFHAIWVVEYMLHCMKWYQHHTCHNIAAYQQPWVNWRTIGALSLLFNLVITFAFGACKVIQLWFTGHSIYTFAHILTAEAQLNEKCQRGIFIYTIWDLINILKSSFNHFPAGYFHDMQNNVVEKMESSPWISDTRPNCVDKFW